MSHPAREFEIAASGNTRGRWDGKRVQQVIRNLVSNAIKYSLPDFPIRVTLDGQESDVLLEVSNSGQIDPVEARHLFNPLSRGSRGRSAESAREGLGIGLFVVQEITKAHGGEIDVTCESGVTTFTVRLPREAKGGAREEADHRRV